MAILFDITYVIRFMEDIIQYTIIDRYHYTIQVGLFMSIKLS